MLDMEGVPTHEPHMGNPNFASKASEAFESKFGSFPIKLAVLAARFTPSNIIVVTKFLFSCLTLLEVNKALIAWSYRYG